MNASSNSIRRTLGGLKPADIAWLRETFVPNSAQTNDYDAIIEAVSESAPAELMSDTPRKVVRDALRSVGLSVRQVDAVLRSGWAGVVGVREAEAAAILVAAITECMENP